MSAPDVAPASRLMVSGWLIPAGAGQAVEVVRGMPVADAAGLYAGTVAGVSVAGRTGVVGHLILTRDAAAGDYRLVPADQVARLDDQVVRLRLAADALLALPRHCPD